MINTDTNINLTLNSLSEEDLKSLESSGTLQPNQLWLTPDVSTKADVQNTLNTLLTKTSNHEGTIISLQTAINTHHHDSTYLKLLGGTMLGPIVLAGGEASSGVGNIQLDSDGQITAKGTTSTLFGRSNNGTDLLIGHSSYATKLRGSAANPTYNDINIVLQTTLNDYVTLTTEQSISGTKTFTGNIFVPDVTIT